MKQPALYDRIIGIYLVLAVPAWYRCIFNLFQFLQTVVVLLNKLPFIEF